MRVNGGVRGLGGNESRADTDRPAGERGVGLGLKDYHSGLLSPISFPRIVVAVCYFFTESKTEFKFKSCKILNFDFFINFRVKIISFSPQ